MGRAIWYALRLLLGFRVLSAEQLRVVPPIFSDPATLDANIEASNLRGPETTRPFWEYHRLLRDRMRTNYPHDCGMFNCIAKTGEVIQQNQLTYVIYRRITLAAFLVILFLMTPTHQLDWIYRLTSDGPFGKSHPNPVATLGLWSAAALILAVLFITLNRMTKSWYDSAISNTTANLVVHISTYNNRLYIDGYKRSLERMDEEEAEYGSAFDETIWPERARKWAKLSFWNYRRIEQIERMCSNYAWDSQRTLKIVDILARIFSLLMFGSFALALWLSYSDRPRFRDATSIFGQDSAGFLVLLAVSFTLSLIVWDRLGREQQDVFEKSMFSRDKRDLWVRSADFREQFANQIYKNKSRIQRDRPNRGITPAVLHPPTAPLP